MSCRIKICCIASINEAKIAIVAGADALGLVGKMPNGPGPIEDELIALIAKTIPPPIASFLLTSEQSAEAIIIHALKTHTNTIQIVDELTQGSYSQIRKALPSIRLVQVIHITGEESIEQALKVQANVDALLLDSGNPRAAIKTLGGTGNIHNWNISSRLVELVAIPVFLAGGLHPGNVRQAINTVKPFGVDVCSGVRTAGLLDKEKLESFISAVKSS